MIPPPPSSTLFPYTTLFRSRHAAYHERPGHERRVADRQRQTLRHRPDGSRLVRSEEHTSELQSHSDLVCRLLLEKKKIAKTFLPFTHINIPATHIVRRTLNS